MVVPSPKNQQTLSRYTNWNCSAQHKKETNILIQLNNRIAKSAFGQINDNTQKVNSDWFMRVPLIIYCCFCRFRTPKIYSKMKIIEITYCVLRKYDWKKREKQTQTQTRALFRQHVNIRRNEFSFFFFFSFDGFLLLFSLVDTVSVVVVVVVVARFRFDHFRGHKYRVKLKKQLTILFFHYFIFQTSTKVTSLELSNGIFLLHCVHTHA